MYSGGNEDGIEQKTRDSMKPEERNGVEGLKGMQAMKHNISGRLREGSGAYVGELFWDRDGFLFVDCGVEKCECPGWRSKRWKRKRAFSPKDQPLFGLSARDTEKSIIRPPMSPQPLPGSERSETGHTTYACRYAYACFMQLLIQPLLVSEIFVLRGGQAREQADRHIILNGRPSHATIPLLHVTASVLGRIITCGFSFVQLEAPCSGVMIGNEKFSESGRVQEIARAEGRAWKGREACLSERYDGAGSECSIQGSTSCSCRRHVMGFVTATGEVLAFGSLGS